MSSAETQWNRLVLGTCRGFTLIEMLIVILIMGLIGGLVGPAIWCHGCMGQKSIVPTQLRGFSQAIDMFRHDVGCYPSRLEDLLHPSGKGWNGPYLRDVKTLPKDPWGHDFRYCLVRGGQDYSLYSLGTGDGEIRFKGGNCPENPLAPRRPGGEDPQLLRLEPRRLGLLSVLSIPGNPGSSVHLERQGK